MKKYTFISLLLLVVFSNCKIERVDKKYSYTASSPAYPAKDGPAVYIDEAHHNAHTMSTSYKPFSDVLRSDGYNIFPFKESFSISSLEKVQILVIVNALNEKNVGNQALPNYSAFTKDEIIAVKNWVENGGSLFLVADHMPFPGAASDLAAEFGFILTNSFAMRSKYRGRITYSIADKTLHSYTPITNQIDSIHSYFGSAFQAPKEAHNIFSIPGNFKIYLTERPWRFPKSIPIISSENLSQGAVLEYGKGKVAMFSEGAMFTAQYIVFDKAGINSPKAKYNTQFLLNLTHWLDKARNSKK